MKRRVVITGLGAVTPIGNTVNEFWNGIKEEKVGIGEITKFDTHPFSLLVLYVVFLGADIRTPGI